MDYNGRFDRNIGLAVYENLGAGMSNWQAKINCMDELWTSSMYAEECFRSMGVTIPIEVVPHAFDISVYSKSYEKISHPELDGNFIFYTIADLNRRKDIGSLIKAFHLAFTPNEPVKLLIKTSKYGLTPNQCAESLSRDCKAIKEGMKLCRRTEDYIDEVIIPEFLEEEELMRVHSTGHCFVSTSHGEAWNQPLFDAASMGKFCIHTQQDSEVNHYDYAAGIPVPCHDTISFGSEGFFELGSSREIFTQVEPHILAGIMRNVYENQDNTKYSKMCQNNAISNKRYSYENIGEHIKGLLEC
jgi:glycosyltransferase involved in cell wall biosynthesis